MPRQAAWLLHSFLFLLQLCYNEAVSAFITDLEACIRNHAIKAAETFPLWGNSCLPPTSKVDIQGACTPIAALRPSAPPEHLRTMSFPSAAKIYEETLSPFHDKYGYHAALWCAMYSLGMTGAEFNPKDTQPNNPNFSGERSWINRFASRSTRDCSYPTTSSLSHKHLFACTLLYEHW